jgi:hypothetical protein
MYSENKKCKYTLFTPLLPHLHTYIRYCDTITLTACFVTVHCVKGCNECDPVTVTRMAVCTEDIMTTPKGCFSSIPNLQFKQQTRNCHTTHHHQSDAPMSIEHAGCVVAQSQASHCGDSGSFHASPCWICSGRSGTTLFSEYFVFFKLSTYMISPIPCTHISLIYHRNNKMLATDGVVQLITEQ